MLEHLQRRGDEALVIALSDPVGVPDSYAGFSVVTTPSLTLPWYPDMRLSATLTAQVARRLADFAPDVVHPAAPVVLGYKGVLAAARVGAAQCCAVPDRGAPLCGPIRLPSGRADPVAAPAQTAQQQEIINLGRLQLYPG